MKNVLIILFLFVSNIVFAQLNEKINRDLLSDTPKNKIWELSPNSDSMMKSLNLNVDLKADTKDIIEVNGYKGYILGINVEDSNFTKKLTEKNISSDSIKFYVKLKDSLYKALVISEMNSPEFKLKKEISDVYTLGNKYGISFLEYDVIGNDYSIGLNFNVLNNSKKTIKYLYLTLQAFNPVNDPVGGVKKITAIGPIEKGVNSTYKFENIVYSSIATSISLLSLKIQYMDGSTKIIPKSLLYDLMLSDEAYEYLISK